MKDTALMEECRALIEFYDGIGSDWTSALAFTLTRDLFGGSVCVHPIEGYRCYPYPRRERVA